jgi:succinate-semialdehyde dehydrogenase/glutarate-semialdehyde dehydrogenase
MDWEIDMGPLISSAQFDRVTTQVADAVKRGATVVVGGSARPDIAPTFFEPTILTDVTDDMELGAGETFGPVVSVYRVADDAEAILRANDSEYGLNASVWTRRPADVVGQIRSGTITVNEGFSASWASHGAPMGGMKTSGMGRRHGREGILKYAESQTVAAHRQPIKPRLCADAQQTARNLEQAFLTRQTHPDHRKYGEGVNCRGFPRIETTQSIRQIEPVHPISLGNVYSTFDKNR